ncbi:MAG: hypothetical protein LBN09_02315 [Clostridioides sp.]|jgi:hypothetical protein|nr:hypothetical protein [Clostridioides sp.]
MEIDEGRQQLKQAVIELVNKGKGNYSAKKSINKYIQSNIDSVLEYKLSNYKENKDKNLHYKKVLKQCTYQKNINSVAKVLRGQKSFRKKEELLEFSNFIGFELGEKKSYSALIKELSAYIFDDIDSYSRRFFYLKKGGNKYLLDAEDIKEELSKGYKEKSRAKMVKLAKNLNVDVCRDDTAEDIRFMLISRILSGEIKL